MSRLWQQSRDLVPFRYPVADFPDFDQDIWFGDRNEPTIRSILAHVRRIDSADLSYPIILSESGIVMDGIHRICKAQLNGDATVAAVQFETNPEPDEIR